MDALIHDRIALNDLDPIWDSMLDAVVVTDREGIVTGWNTVAIRLFGRTADEALGQPISELIVSPRSRTTLQPDIGRLQGAGLARAVNRRIEITASDKGGREFLVELTLIEAPGDRARHFIGFLREISERQATESRLALSEESLRLATEAAEVGTWDIDLTTNVLTLSDRSKAMLGLSPGAAFDIGDSSLGIHPDDRAAVNASFMAAVDPAIRSLYDVDYRVIGKEDGVLRWVAGKGKGLFDDSGVCVRAVGTLIDITARKRDEGRAAFMFALTDVLRGADTDAALREASAMMGRHFEVARVGYGHLDPVEDVFDYDVCWTDGSVQPLLGRFPARAFGAKIVAKLSAGETVVVGDLLTAEISDEAETRATAAQVDTRAILVVPFVRAGRLRTIVYLNDRPARHWAADEVAFIEAVADRTRQVIARAEAEAALRNLNATLEARVEARTAELRETEAALRQSQKMEAVGQLTGGLAHDFNNLLTGITGALDLIGKRIGQGRFKDVDHLMPVAQGAAKRAAALTHRLLAFSRRQTLDPKPTDMNRLVAGMDDLLRRTVGPSIAIETVAAGGLWTTLVDPNQLENALLNLCINARDAMPEGGRLTIETGNRWLDQRAAQERDLSPGQYVSLCVSDTGSGMSPDVIAKAFDPFFTTKPLGQGTGLGLSMIYGFVRQSGGQARIYSEVGQGSMVCLYLPRHLGAAERIEHAPEIDAAPRAIAGETVLVVDDEPSVRMLVVEILEDLGYAAIEAADGASGLKVLQSDARIDLLISDVGLPGGMNGRQMADAARAVRPQLKVLFITGFAENAVVGNGHLDPGMHVMTKPFAMEAIAARIRTLINER